MAKDKEYFVRLYRAVKRDCKLNLIVLIGVSCLFTLILLHLVAKVIDANVWQVSSIVVVVVMAILLRRRISSRARIERVAPNDFDPVSLGILLFTFAVTLWINEHIGDLPILLTAIFVSLVDLTFLVAVLIPPVRRFINKQGTYIVMSLVFLASVFGFALGWLPAISQLSGGLQVGTIVFGFLWAVVMLLVMIRDVKNELVRILSVVFFVVAAVMKFCIHDTVSVYSGIALLVIAALIYLMNVGHLPAPYGKLW